MDALSIFKKMVKKQKDNLSDEEILLSAPFTEHLTGMATVICDAWKYRGKPISIHLLKSANFVACTDCGRNIKINVNSSIMDGMDMIHKAIFIIGLNLHECGHILFTNSKKEKEIIKSMIEDGFMAKDCDAVNDYLQRSNKGIRTAVTDVFSYFANCIEDGHIEYRLLKKFPNWAEYLQLCRDVQLNNAEENPVSKMIKDEADAKKIFFHLLLIYAKYNTELFEESDCGEQAVANLQSIEPLIDMAVAENHSEERIQIICEAFNAVFLALIQKPNEQNSSDSEEEQEQNSTSGNQGSSQSGQSENDSSSQGGDNSSSSQDSSDNSSNTGDSEGEGMSGESQSSSSNGSGSNNSSSQSGNMSAGGNQMSDEEIEEMMKNLSSIAQNIGSDNTQDSDDALTGSPTANENADDNIEESSMKGNGYDTESLSSMLQNTAESVAEEKAMQQADEEAVRQLHILNNNLDTGNYHQNVSSNVHKEQKSRASSYDDDMYFIKPILRRLLGEFKKIIQDMQNGGRINGLYFGRKLTQPYRTDFKRFSKNVAPEKIPDLAVCLYIDLSGSMSGKKEAAARKLAMLLYLFCKELGVDIAIYGHHAHSRRVTIIQYCNYGSFSKYDLDRISNIQAYNSCNRDGYGLRLCAEELSKQQADKKLFFIVSDGAPNDDGYDIRNATKDIHEILLKYQRKGVRFVVAGLLQDAPVIKSIYSDGLSPQVAAKFLDISELENMPKLFTSIIKKEILR